MSCNFPMLRAETYETYTNKKGGLSYKAEFLERGFMDQYKNNIEGLRETFKDKYRRIQLVPCGQCIECRLSYSRDRATQMMLHKYYGYHEVFNEEGNPLDKGHKYPEGTCWFITITYKDEFLPPVSTTIDTDTGEIFKGISLDKREIANFVKDLRYAFKDSHIQYVMAGEYGSLNQRPHYHFIMYGLPLDQTQFKKVGMNALNQPTWECKELEKIWATKNGIPKGFVNVGRVDWRSCAYVARYTLKKAFQKDKDWYMAQGLEPEYIAWSNGIGKSFFEENYKELYKTDSVPILGKCNGLPKPPKSYDRMLKEIDPKLYDQVKKKRDKAGVTKEILLNQKTDYTPEERRAIAEARMRSVMKDLRTEV